MFCLLVWKSCLLSTAAVSFSLPIPDFGLELMPCRWFCQDTWKLKLAF